MAFKQRSSGPFKMMGSSPAKQKDFNKTGSGASTTPGYGTTKGAKKVKAFKEFDKWHNTLKKSKSVISNFGKKAGKFIGGKALGVASMMMATSSKADQPTYRQKNQNQFKKPDFKAINKDLAKSMYRPLPKKK